MHTSEIAVERPPQTALPANAGGYTVRRIDHENADDRELIRPLLREYFDGIPGIDFDARYKWLYLANPAGLARTYVACIGDRAVGITSLFPRSVRVGARDATGAIGGDGYVSPAYRRRGIVTSLHRAARRGMDADLSFMFGPPEPANLRTLLQAGAVLTGAVRRYTRPLKARLFGPIVARSRYAGMVDRIFRPGISSLRIESLGAGRDARVDRVWGATRRDVALHGEVVPVTDAAFYAWRFSGDRQKGLLVLDGDEPVAVAAIERHGSRGAILDVTCPRASFRSVVRTLVFALADAEAVDIQIHVPSRARELALYSLGFVPRQTKVFQVQVQGGSPVHALLTRATAWKYMWSDGDLDQIL